MEKKPTQPMTPFDEMTTPAGLKAVKLMFPYTPVSVRQRLAILIKFAELRHTVQAFGQLSVVLQSQGSPSSPEEILDEILPYLSPESASMLESFRNMMDMMEMIQMFQEMGGSSVEKEEGSAEDPAASGQSGLTDLLMGMLTPELKDMLQMYQTMFSDTDPPLKGSETHE